MFERYVYPMILNQCSELRSIDFQYDYPLLKYNKLASKFLKSNYWHVDILIDSIKKLDLYYLNGFKEMPLNNVQKYYLKGKMFIVKRQSNNLCEQIKAYFMINDLNYKYLKGLINLTELVNELYKAKLRFYDYI